MVSMVTSRLRGDASHTLNFLGSQSLSRQVRRMPDVFSKAKRSEVMSRIRSHGNKDTEQRLVTIFRAHGITGWRRQVPLSIPLAGNDRGRVRPDFVFRAVHRHLLFSRGEPSRSRPPTKWAIPQKTGRFRLSADAKGGLKCTFA